MKSSRFILSSFNSSLVLESFPIDNYVFYVFLHHDPKTCWRKNLVSRKASPFITTSPILNNANVIFFIFMENLLHHVDNEYVSNISSTLMTSPILTQS